MLRTFATHQHRITESLDGLWEFATADTGPQPRRLRPPGSFDSRLHVPGPWERRPDLVNYRGQAWYRRTFTALPGFTPRIVFGGVSHTGTAMIDGRVVGRHDDAYTPWAVHATGVEAGEHELSLHVDNTFGPHAGLHLENDYYTYGGITRPVELQHVPDVFIERVAATPQAGRGGKWSLDLIIELTNLSDQPQRRGLAVDLAGRTHDLGGLTVAPSTTRAIRRSLDGLAVRPWSLDKPHLYRLHTRLLDGEAVVDDLIDRIGFREVAVRGRKLLLNGRPIRLRGFNRHEDYQPFGCGIPLDAMAVDLELIRDMGGNFVRTCHYPNDMRFLDLCDELGIAVWEESHARQVKFDHPRYREQVTRSSEEMVRWHHNHPAILMWGCLNECESRTPEGAAEHGRVLKLIKKLDPSRPVTYASMFHRLDKAYRYADIVSWNRYIGWYGGGIDQIESNIRDLLKWLHGSDRTGGRNKPVILSEFGVGAIPGYRNANRCKWSEEYQCDVLDESLRVYLNHPDIVGTAIWQFCDVRITPGWNWDRRPRTMNNKGVVDEHRRPKLAYEVVKRRHAEAARRWDRAAG